ncbi:MAG: radical SAM family heme chaperone HemW, partial [Actinomycetota bacterium]
MTASLAVYIHWPFCLSKCPYCDFNSHVAAAIDQRRWRAALLAELEWFAALAPGRTVTSIFFGGGTPTLMDPDTAGALVDRVKALWATAPDLEVTLEANPSTVEAGRFRAFRAAGVGRLSLGIQALDDAALKLLGRRHDLAEALAALAVARQTFDRFSFDLIYARPGQTVAAWRDELARALDMAGDHLSLYQLTIEEGTAFAPVFARGDLVLPPEDEAAEMFEATQDMTAAAGLPAYEVSNHARPGQESRHNLTYWLGGDYAGVGPGAHGRLGGEA